MADEGATHVRGPGDVQEVLNYVRALNHGLAVIAERPVTLTLVRDLHEILMTGVRGHEKTPGRFRERQNIIGSPDADLSTATYIPPPVLHMRDCLEGLERYILATDEPDHALVRTALIHYQFEAIHPFNDGNGRLGRLLISLLTVAWGVLPHPLLYLSAYFERERETYYARLRGVTQEGAWSEWLAFYLTGVREQALDAARRAKRLEDLRADFSERVADARMQTIANKLVAGLFAQPVVSIASAAAMMDAKYHLARRYVHKLIELGVLAPYRQSGHTDYFIAVEVMAAVGDK
jgi:Fic family protein